MQRSGEDITSKRLVPVLDSKDTANRSSDGRTARCIRFLALHVLTLCLIVLGTSAAVAAGEQDAVGRIVRQQGPVTGLRDAEPRSLYVGAPVYRGDRIITGADAKVEIEFRDGSNLSIGSGTEVEVTRFRPDARERGRFTLLIGIIRASLADSWTDGFEVWTRAAIASVRSTEWVTEAQENRSSVFVVAGQVEVTGAADGSRVVLSAEFGTDVEIGGAPSPPKRWGGSRVADVLARTRLP